MPSEVRGMLRYFKMIARSPGPAIFILFVVVLGALSVAIQVSYRKAFAYPHNFDMYHPEN